MLIAVFLFAEVGVSAGGCDSMLSHRRLIILLAWVIDQLPGCACAFDCAVGVGLILGAHQTITHHKMQRAFIDLPAGRVATTQQMGDGLRLVAEYVRPGDAIFQAAWPGVYLPLHVRNPTAFETVGVSDMPRPGDVELVTRAA